VKKRRYRKIIDEANHKQTPASVWIEAKQMIMSNAKITDSDGSSARKTLKRTRNRNPSRKVKDFLNFYLHSPFCFSSQDIIREKGI